MENILIGWTTSPFEPKIWPWYSDPSSVGCDAVMYGIHKLLIAISATSRRLRTREQVPPYISPVLVSVVRLFLLDFLFSQHLTEIFLTCDSLKRCGIHPECFGNIIQLDGTLILNCLYVVSVTTTCIHIRRSPFVYPLCMSHDEWE